ncbi:carnosine N-methyltransferase [Chytriomyces confervae]|uniref:carnosine N-methyltransferase n=1 Tax=Chytriomyces confervae TaxID=246404 RepID=A0A507D2M4_9FUNG|nr:carnosine N-methyltransferase [Chytriomyces confervae]
MQLVNIKVQQKANLFLVLFAVLVAVYLHYQHQKSDQRHQPNGHAHPKNPTTATLNNANTNMFNNFLSPDPALPVPSSSEIEAEERVFNKSVRAFNKYATHSLAAIAKKRKDYNSARTNLRNLVPKTELDSGKDVFEKRLEDVESCIKRNQEVVRSMVVAMGADPDSLDVPQGRRVAGRPNPDSVVMDGDMDKVRSTLRQFVRDWSAEGAAERHDTYSPIMETLERIYSHLPISERGGITVLVPGAGLGRLAFDIVRQGFTTQGNEFSFYMLIASNFVLNSMKTPNSFTIYPWVHSFSNMQNAEHQLRSVQIPDIAPGGIPETADFSMVAGDFLEVYGGYKERGAWDVLVSCYFIDTAKNIFEYLGVIWNALKPGGVWINHGPLLYHFEGMKNEMSIELNLEEVKAVAKNMGFIFEEERMIPSTYTSNENSMLKYIYNCAFWVARKPSL